MNKVAIYPGTFDPIHMGHIDIVERASRIFDEVIIAIAVNIDKNPLFTIQERMDLADGATSHLKNIKTLSTEGLIADFAKEHSACGLIRGLRHVSDFEFEAEKKVGPRRLRHSAKILHGTSFPHIHHKTGFDALAFSEREWRRTGLQFCKECVLPEDDEHECAIPEAMYSDIIDSAGTNDKLAP